MRRAMIGVFSLALVACHRSAGKPSEPPVARIPRDAARFEIDAVDDSTARFRPKEASWVRVGMQAYAVDPINRDVLVARLRVTAADGGNVTALVTSQVTRVTTSHFLLVVRPSVPWWRARTFWVGAAAGSAAGAATAVLTR